MYVSDLFEKHPEALYYPNKSKKKLLDKQLIIVSDSNYNPGKVFELNKKFKLEDSNFEKK